MNIRPELDSHRMAGIGSKSPDTGLMETPIRILIFSCIKVSLRPD